jgi:hypothetical protein
MMGREMSGAEERYGDGDEVDLFAQLLAQAKDDGLQDRLDDLRVKEGNNNNKR